MEPYLTVSEVARALGVSKDSVRAYAKTGRLPGRRTNSGVRLFVPRDVARFKIERERAQG